MDIEPMATFIPQPPDDESRSNFSLEEAKDFSESFCQPKDEALVSDIDENAREAAWRLLRELEKQQLSSCECEKCISEDEMGAA